MRRIFLFLPFLIFFNCSNQKKSISEEIAENALYFATPQSPYEIPQRLIETISLANIIVLGERHYVQEHHEFVSLLLKRLYEKGVRLFTVESNFSDGLLFDLYVSGAEIDLSEEQKNLNIIWLDSLREFNQKLIKENKPLLRMNCFDMNHWEDSFLQCLRIYTNYISDNLDLKDKVGQIGLSTVSSDKYISLIKDLKMEMENNRYGLNEEEINNLIELCSVELRSLPVRKKFDDQIREDIIIYNINRSVSKLNINEKLVINCGMWHAQKTAYWKIGIQKWLGEELQKIYPTEELYHLALFGLEGNYKYGYYSKERNYFNILESDAPDNLSKYIAKIANGKITFVDFSKSDFKEKITIDYGQKDNLVTAIPGVHFDGLLIYPLQSVLESSKYYEH